MPALSIVTPVLNSAAYLTAALDSIARVQTPHEHIVIDGGSTDGTVDLLRARHDPVLSWISEPDRGQTDAVNKAPARARDDVLAWINGDDEVVPEAFDRALQHVAANPSARSPTPASATTPLRSRRSTSGASRTRRCRSPAPGAQPPRPHDHDRLRPGQARRLAHAHTRAVAGAVRGRVLGCADQHGSRTH